LTYTWAKKDIPAAVSGPSFCKSASADFQKLGPKTKPDMGAAVDVYVGEERYTGGSFPTEFLKIRIRGFSNTRPENKT